MPPPSYAQDPSGNVVMTLKVPEKFMGGLLGKAGVVIKSIMQLSGAVIRASPKGEGGDEAFRAMKVTGTGSQVQQAQAAVMHRIVELANNPSAR